MYLVNVRCHSRDQRGRAERVERCEVKPSDVAYEVVTELGRRADRGLRGKKLRRKAGKQSQYGKQNHNSEPRNDVSRVVVRDADIYNVGNNQRNDQVKRRLKHFKKRRKNRIQPVFFEKRYKVLQALFLLYVFVFMFYPSSGAEQNSISASPAMRSDSKINTSFSPFFNKDDGT